ncbi:ABC transporter substrate-binding protein [Nocardioides daeguensis]|uniref:Leucine-binding protein domain-containing protein n=1 Tax=Nocardioides daeguensis TaxID=908359 RepID=A0ABP6VVK7_9ACTN|nr:ABC transporter substrate-binding protein [Nocardioides daeguensis]MBV6728409.1 ABC transporter substrate-binding protein [Nocardioides daeguensis]MCR1773833.1 ABC transporter substrate-binding protein [Nocardioides daeguensis]
MPRTSRARRLLCGCVVVLALSACGSQLDPSTVAQVNGQTGGGGSAQSGDAAVVGDGGGVPAAGADAADGGAPAPADGAPAGPAADGGGAAPGDTTTGSGGKTKGKGSPTGTAKAASCDGFKNQTGITDSTITLANVADISGPVPGIFEASQQAARAYVAYFNSQNTICGRKLAISNLDSRADAGADQQAYTKACSSAFAAVGSMGAFDSGGAAAAQGCGLPDIRAAMTTPERAACSTCFGIYSVRPNLIADSGPKWLAAQYPDAVKNVGVLYINGGAAVVNAKSQAAAWGKMGWSVNYIQGIDVAEFNFAPYVQQLKSKGIKMVVYTGPYQNTVKLQQAMQQQGYKPDVFMQDPTIYDQRYIQQAGSLAEGTVVYSTTDLFENKANPEVQLYLSWLNQVKPGAVPNFYGLYAWSAMRLFVEQATTLGGKLTRESLVAAVRKVNDWTGNGAHTAMRVGTAETPPCQKIIQYKGGRWQQISPGAWLCGSVVNSGVGG